MAIIDWLASFKPGEIVWVEGLMAALFVRLPYELAKRRRPVVHSRADALDATLLVLFVVLLIGPPAVALNSTWFAFADWPHQTPLPLAIGTALMLFALWMLVRVHAALGDTWSRSLRIREGQPLVTDGIYARLRHPMYAAGLLVGLAQLALLDNWVAGMGGLLAMAGIVIIRVPREEAMMIEWYGEAYCAYRRRTGAILPWFGRR